MALAGKMHKSLKNCLQPTNLNQEKKKKNIIMADGCKNDAPSSLSSRSQSSQSGSPKHCSVCGVAVKDHLGPHGPTKCLVKLIESLSQRVERLENVNQRQVDELQL